MSGQQAKPPQAKTTKHKPAAGQIRKDKTDPTGTYDEPKTFGKGWNW